jgi:hypothetical protein
VNLLAALVDDAGLFPPESHGFLNLVLAGVRAAAGLAAEARAVSGRALSAARLLFRAYGSCSTSEPREEAAALGLLP